MQRPDNALTARSDVFAEPWYAQTLAAASGCVEAGHFSAAQWSDALGKALREADASGLPDTEETYYLSALKALEALIPLPPEDLLARKSAWRKAYLSTPHGAPVTLE